MRLGILKTLIFVILLAAAAVILLPDQVKAAGAADYQIESYNFIARINSDGSAEVKESIIYDFSENENSVDFFINQLRTARVEGIRVFLSEKNPDPGLALENDHALVMQELLIAESASAPSPMTYVQSEMDDSVRLRMNAVYEKNSTRLVVLEYKLTDLVRRSPDTAFIRQRIAGFPEDIKIRSVDVQYILPYEPQGSDSLFMVLSEDSLALDYLQTDRWHTSWSKTSPDNSFDYILIMPPEQFAGVTVSDQLPGRQELISIINSSISRADQQRFWQQSVRALVFILLALSLLLLLVIYLLFDREGVSSFKRKYLLPKNIEYPPAVLSVLMRTSKPGILIMSTMIDLVKRGELELEGLVFSWRNPDRNDYTGFKAYEIFLLHWFFDQISQEHNTLSTIQIRDYARDSKTSEAFRGYYEQFRKLLDEELPGYGLFDEQKGRYGRIIGFSLSVTYLVLAGASSLYLQSFAGLLLIIPSVMFYLYALSLRHLTGSGNEQYAYGKAMRRYLESFFDHRESMDTELPDKGDLAYVLPYAIALDRTKQFMKQVISFSRSGLFDSEALTGTYQKLSSNTVRDKAGNIAAGGKGKLKVARPAGTADGPLDLTDDQDKTEAAKAAAVEQVRLLGRDLVSMESMLSASFYLSANFHLVDDH